MNPRPAPKRQPGRPVPYTAAEDAKLLALYPSASKEEILAALPGRNWHGVRQHANELRIARNFLGKWEPADVELLLANYEIRGGNYVAAAIGQRPARVHRKAAALGLRVKLAVKPKPAPKPRPAARVKPKPRKAARVAKPKAERPVAVKPPVVRSAPKALPPAGKNQHAIGTPNANMQRAARLAAEQAKKQQPAVTAEMIRRLPAAHPARLAYTRAAYHGPDAAAAAYYSAMQQAA